MCRPLELSLRRSKTFANKGFAWASPATSAGAGVAAAAANGEVLAEELLPAPRRLHFAAAAGISPQRHHFLRPQGPWRCLSYSCSQRWYVSRAPCVAMRRSKEG
mmetsp:Transcript_60602/g.173786  ORF Transcript_60602/g.173786 Transcript_60602/m.173786 type:complete len:104 (+) Transcript_60602:1052-1363(+)